MLEITQDSLWLYRHIPTVITALLARKDTEKFGLGVISKIARDIVAEKYALASDTAEKAQRQKSDMLGHLIAQGLTQKEAQAESHLQILAGSDSTATTIKMMMLHTVTNPSVYQTLRTEINTDVAAGKISGLIKDSEARQLSYLQAVIWEELRICPPLPGLGTKVAPPQGENFRGYTFPEGVEVGFCPESFTRSRETFCEESHISRFERRLEADETTYAKHMSVAELIFGSGRFGCLGKSIAMLELNKVFVEVSCGTKSIHWAHVLMQTA